LNRTAKKSRRARRIGHQKLFIIKIGPLTLTFQSGSARLPNRVHHLAFGAGTNDRTSDGTDRPNSFYSEDHLGYRDCLRGSSRIKKPMMSGCINIATGRLLPKNGFGWRASRNWASSTSSSTRMFNDEPFCVSRPSGDGHVRRLCVRFGWRNCLPSRLDRTSKG